MAKGDEEEYDSPNYSGFSKYFNNKTIRGRANWAIFWYSFYALSFITYKITKNMRSTPPPVQIPEKPDNVSSSQESSSGSYNCNDVINEIKIENDELLDNLQPQPCNQPQLKPGYQQPLQPSNEPQLQPSNELQLQKSNEPQLQLGNHPALEPNNKPQLQPTDQLPGNRPVVYYYPHYIPQFVPSSIPQEPDVSITNPPVTDKNPQYIRTPVFYVPVPYNQTTPTPSTDPPKINQEAEQHEPELTIQYSDTQKEKMRAEEVNNDENIPLNTDEGYTDTS